jgi:hypothetical protein
MRLKEERRLSTKGRNAAKLMYFSFLVINGPANGACAKLMAINRNLVFYQTRSSATRQNGDGAPGPTPPESGRLSRTIYRILAVPQGIGKSLC